MNIKCIDLYQAHHGREAFVKVISVADLGNLHLSIQSKTLVTGNIPEIKHTYVCTCMHTHTHRHDNMRRAPAFLEMPLLQPQTHSLALFPWKPSREKKYISFLLFSLHPPSPRPWKVYNNYASWHSIRIKCFDLKTDTLGFKSWLRPDLFEQWDLRKIISGNWNLHTFNMNKHHEHIVYVIGLWNALCTTKDRVKSRNIDC